MKKILIKILFKLLGYKVTPPHLVDGNDFIIKFNNKFYIMTNYTLQQTVNEPDRLQIVFSDILSVIDGNERRWDF